MKITIDSEDIIKCFPHNWCDPLLTGKNAVIQSNVNCREIEGLIYGIEERVNRVICDAIKEEK